MHIQNQVVLGEECPFVLL